MNGILVGVFAAVFGAYVSCPIDIDVWQCGAYNYSRARIACVPACVPQLG